MEWLDNRKRRLYLLPLFGLFRATQHLPEDVVVKASLVMLRQVVEVPVLGHLLPDFDDLPFQRFIVSHCNSIQALIVVFQS